MNLSKTIATAMFLSAIMVTLPACERDGPMEEAGEQVDDSIEDAGDAIEDAGDAIEDATDGN